MQAMALANLRSPAPMRDLAEWLHCDASNVTGIVDGLERRGLVTRQSSPSDRRVKHLVLTEEGERRRDLLHARSAQNARAVFGLPDADREQLRDLLARLLDTGADHGCH
ncbi:MarR family transcriptional regulator [Dactylosporangium aurantiacum]|uniref:MarR family transcriptional regulator n=2 Tax=Dactylosporangium aurantiacum TaxID=35754 RepID=A0A9Q9MHN3_9ACTN|nr:MarR family transcriptional regulator [Dactylosporangium aurantiacum]